MIIDQPPIKVVSKSWGYEKIICNKQQYCGKLLHIIKGQSTSLHFHILKDETFFVHSGKVMVYYSDERDKLIAISNGANEEAKLQIYLPGQNILKRITLNAGDNFYIPPARVHQIVALEDTSLYEFSTKHEDSDSHRLMNERRVL